MNGNKFSKKLGQQLDLNLRDKLLLGGGFLSLFLYMAFFYQLSGPDPLWKLNAPKESLGYILGRDFLNFWNFGRAAFEDNPGRYYDLNQYSDLLDQQLSPAYPRQQWSYPPSLMLVAAPFGLLPYGLAFGLFSLLCVAAFGFALAQYRAQNMYNNDYWREFALYLASPAAFMCFISGQMAVLIAAMMLGIFQLLDRRPVVAGILIGLLSIKPQVGLLFPVYLAVSSRWRCFGAATASTLLIAGLTTLFFGADVWRQFLELGVPAQADILRDPPPVIAALMPTIFMDGWIAGARYATGMWLQAIFAGFAVLSLIFVLRQKWPEELTQVIFLLASVSVTPYLMCYDLVIVTFVAIYLSQHLMLDEVRQTITGKMGTARMETGRMGVTGRALIALVYFLPVVHFLAGMMHIPGTAALPALLILWLLVQSGRRSANFV